MLFITRRASLGERGMIETTEIGFYEGGSKRGGSGWRTVARGKAYRSSVADSLQ